MTLLKATNGVEYYLPFYTVPISYQISLSCEMERNKRRKTECLIFITVCMREGMHGYLVHFIAHGQHFIAFGFLYFQYWQMAILTYTPLYR